MTALIADYYRHLTVDLRRSDHTVRAYVATAERLCGFLSAHWGEAIDRPALSRVSAADLRAFLAARRGEGLTAASTARELSAVRTFLHWTGVEPPPLKGPRRKRSLPRPQSPADIMALGEDMAENAAEPWIAARDWAVLLLLCGLLVAAQWSIYPPEHPGQDNALRALGCGILIGFVGLRFCTAQPGSTHRIASALGALGGLLLVANAVLAPHVLWGTSALEVCAGVVALAAAVATVVIEPIRWRRTA